jgi:hypothetical protein
MIESKMNKQVKLDLSTKQKINFNLGYKNNSIICDFMDCEYSCTPTSSVKDDIINTDSYSQSYIIMNLDKIIKRIKSLYKEHYIYDKRDLIDRINAIKNYSTDQINMALNVLITDKNEYLVDMLNRNGRLVNIGDFYLFQPIELDNKHISGYERRVPIDVKIPKLTITLPDEINIIKQEDEEDNIDILLKLQNDYNKALTLNIKSKNKSWIYACAWAINSLVEFDKLDKTDLERYCLEHLFDILNINEKLAIINSLTIKNEQITQDFKEKLQVIIDKFTITDSKGLSGFVCADYKQRYQGKGSKFFWYIFVKNAEEKRWIANAQLVGGIASIMFKKYGKTTAQDCNRDLIGFLTNNRSRTNIIFKTKTVIPGKKRKSGQTCPTSGENRKDIIDRVNYLVGVLGKENDKYKMKSKTKRQDETVYNIKGPLNPYDREEEGDIEVPMTDVQLCIETEFLLRYLDENKEKYDGKRYFFSTIEDVLNSIKDIEKK